MLAPDSNDYTDMPMKAKTKPAPLPKARAHFGAVGFRLRQFPVNTRLPETDADIRRVMQHDSIQEIVHCVLGPAGTNISQAAQRWSIRHGLASKTSSLLCDTPEQALQRARMLTDEDRLALFWTCAVYYREHAIYFENPDCYPFFAQEIMQLDALQLAARSESMDLKLIGSNIVLRIASHPSPVVLLSGFPCQTVAANSNAGAQKSMLRWRFANGRTYFRKKLDNREYGCTCPDGGARRRQSRQYRQKHRRFT